MKALKNQTNINRNQKINRNSKYIIGNKCLEVKMPKCL